MAAWPIDCKLRLNFHSNSCVDTNYRAASDPVTSDCHAADAISSSDAAEVMNAKLTQSECSVQDSPNAMDVLVRLTDDMSVGDRGETKDDVEVEEMLDTNLIAPVSEVSMHCVLGGRQRLVPAVQEDIRAGNKPSDLAGTSRCEQVHQPESIKNTGKYLHCSKTGGSVCFREENTKLVNGVYWNVSAKRSCTIRRKTRLKKIKTLKPSKCRQDCNLMIGEETLVDINVEVTLWLKRCAPPLTTRHIRKLLKTLDLILTCMVNQPPCSRTCPYKMKGSRREELVTLTENLRYKLLTTLETSQQSDMYTCTEATPSSPLEESSGTVQEHMSVMQGDEGKSDYISTTPTQSEHAQHWQQTSVQTTQMFDVQPSSAQVEHIPLLQLTSAEFELHHQMQPATSAQLDHYMHPTSVQNEQHHVQSAHHEQHHVQPTSACNEQHYVQPVLNGQLQELRPPLLSEHQHVDVQLKSAQCDQLEATQRTVTVLTQCVEQNVLCSPMKCENTKHALLSSDGGSMVVPSKKKKSTVRKQKLTVPVHIPNSASHRVTKMMRGDSSITLKHKKRISKSVKSQHVSTDGSMELEIASQSVLQYQKYTEASSNEERLNCSAKPHHDNTSERVVSLAEPRNRCAGAVCLPEGTHKLFSWAGSIRAHYIHSYLSDSRLPVSRDEPYRRDQCLETGLKDKLREIGRNLKHLLAPVCTQYKKKTPVVVKDRSAAPALTGQKQYAAEKFSGCKKKYLSYTNGRKACMHVAIKQKNLT